MKSTKVTFAATVILSIFSISSYTSAANQYQDVTPMIFGESTVIPHFRNIDSNSDGKKDTMSIQYDVYQKNTNTKKFSTTIKSTPFINPLTVCTSSTPDWTNVTMDSPKFLRSGNFMITGGGMLTECGWNTDHDKQAANKTFVYISDTSSPSGLSKIIVFNSSLVGLDIANYNNDGVEHLVVTTLAGSQGSPLSLRIYVFNLTSWSATSDKAYTIYNQ